MIETKPCLRCGKKFRPKTSWQKFCKVKCKTKWWKNRIQKGLELLDGDNVAK